jgi:Ni/Co efflux regulator RcnB
LNSWQAFTITITAEKAVARGLSFTFLLEPRLMHHPVLKTALAVAMSIAALTSVAPAWADKPEWAGQGGQGKHGKGDDHRRADDRDRPRDDDRRRDDGRRPSGGERDRYDSHTTVQVNIGGYFNDGQRRHAHQWYDDQYRTGRCPPGLARKHNGCMPPGQARRWAVGRALPPDVVYYAVPQSVVVQIGVPPAGYRYVRIANDIVLMAVGSRMVVDAITDLGRAF